MTSNDISTASWIKSSHSGPQGACVEVAWLDDDHVGVRDSKNPTGPALTFTSGEWAVLATGIRQGALGRHR